MMMSALLVRVRGNISRRRKKSRIFSSSSSVNIVVLPSTLNITMILGKGIIDSDTTPLLYSLTRPADEFISYSFFSLACYDCDYSSSKFIYYHHYDHHSIIIHWEYTCICFFCSPSSLYTATVFLIITF